MKLNITKRDVAIFAATSAFWIIVLAYGYFTRG